MNKQQEALKLALEALEETLRTLDDENAKPGGAISDTIWYSEHETLFDYIAAQITAIRNALADSALERMAENAREIGLDYEAAQQQEPVACPDGKQCKHGAWCTETYCQEHCEFRASPASKPWVGLTDEQIAEIASTPCAVAGSYVHTFARAIEAKLREKNA